MFLELRKENFIPVQDMTTNKSFVVVVNEI